MPSRALACSLILTIFISGCTQVAPTGSSDPGILAPALTQTISTGAELSETLPKKSPTIEQEAAAGLTQSPEATKAPITAQLTTSTHFRVQTGSLVALANFVAPEAGCNWLGVGGQVFDLNGTPITMLVVEVGGRLEGSDVFHLALTGSASVLGPGGFVITLADHGIDSSGALWIILYDLAGIPLTSKIYFPTYADCTKNFILINFSESIPSDVPPINLPLIQK